MAADEALYDEPNLSDHPRVAPFGIELIDRYKTRSNPRDLCDKDLCDKDRDPAD